MHAEAAGEAGELQRSAEVGVGQGEGVVAVLLRLRQQFVRVGRPRSEGVEALGVQLDVAGRHGRHRCYEACRYQQESALSWNRTSDPPSRRLTSVVGTAHRLRHPPEVETPVVLDPDQRSATAHRGTPPPARGEDLPAPQPQPAGRGASCRPFPMDRWGPAPHASPARGATVRRRPPGRGRGCPLCGPVSAAQRPAAGGRGLSARRERVPACVSCLAGDARERKSDLLDGGSGEVLLELMADQGCGLFPTPRGLLEVDRPLPRGMPFRGRTPASSLPA